MRTIQLDKHASAILDKWLHEKYVACKNYYNNREVPEENKTKWFEMRDAELAIISDIQKANNASNILKLREETYEWLCEEVIDREDINSVFLLNRIFGGE